MAEKQRSRGRVRYDLFWGVLLAATCLMPAALGKDSHLWHLLRREEDPWVLGWLWAAPVAAGIALLGALLRVRSRFRHFLNFAFGAAQLVAPLVAGAIWATFPAANPATLPLADLGEMGWVVLVAMTSIYAGSGVRVVRPGHVAGQAFAALGAIVLVVFSFLPPAGGGRPFAVEQFAKLSGIAEQWRDQVPFLLIAAAAACSTLNLLRSRAEVFLAGVTRLLMVAGVMFWIARPFLEGDASLRTHVPDAWGALRFLCPWFLALDGAIAFVAISITREGQ